MGFCEFAPGPAAAPFVEAFWALTIDVNDARGEPGLVTPDGCVEIVLATEGASLRVAPTAGGTSDASPVKSAALLFGMGTRPLHVDFGSSTRLFGIRLHPAAAVRLLGADLATLRDAVRPAGDVLRELAWDLSVELDGLEDQRQSAKCSDIVAKAVAQRASRGDARVERAIALIMSSGRRVDLSSLARAVGISTRHLDRCFDRFLGMCPKLLCRIARFRAAWNAGFASKQANWAMIADRCGYADQAHLCREFQTFAGISPGKTIGLGLGGQ